MALIKDEKFLVKKESSKFGMTRPPDLTSVAYMDVEVLCDDKFTQFTQISCLLLNDSGIKIKRFFAAVSPTHLKTYTKYKQSSPLLSVLGQQFDKDSNKNLIKDSEKDVEVQTETQALAGLMEFLELSKVNLFINSPLVLTLLREKISREWVNEKIKRVTTLQQFLNNNKVDLGHRYLDIDTEDVVNKILSPEKNIKLENCRAASNSLHQITKWVRNHSSSGSLNLQSFIFASSYPSHTLETPTLNIAHPRLDERSLTMIELKNSYQSSVSTLIKLSYIKIQYLDENSNEGDEKDVLPKEEYSATKSFPLIDLVDDDPPLDVKTEDKSPEDIAQTERNDLVAECNDLRVRSNDLMIKLNNLIENSSNNSYCANETLSKLSLLLKPTTEAIASDDIAVAEPIRLRPLDDLLPSAELPVVNNDASEAGKNADVPFSFLSAISALDVMQARYSSPGTPNQQSSGQDLTFLEQRTIRYLSTDDSESTEKVKNIGLKTEKLLNQGIVGNAEEIEDLQSERAGDELTDKSSGACSTANDNDAKIPENENDDNNSLIDLKQKPLIVNPPTDSKEQVLTTSEPEIFSVDSSEDSDDSSSSESTENMNEPSESFGLNSNITINITANSEINVNAPLTTETEVPDMSSKFHQTQIKSHKKCLLCQSNDGASSQITLVCQNCPTTRIINDDLSALDKAKETAEEVHHSPFGLGSNCSSANLTLDAGGPVNRDTNANVQSKTKEVLTNEDRFCYQNWLHIHSRCAMCQTNDRRNLLTIECGSCQKFKLVVSGFIESGKFCVAKVINLPESVRCLKVCTLPARRIYQVPVFKDGNRTFVVLFNDFDDRVLHGNTVQIGGPIVGFGQVSCLEEAKMEKMKDEVQISFSSWLDVFHKTQNGASEKDFLATPNILVADRQNQPQPTSNQPLPHTNHPQPSCTYCQGNMPPAQVEPMKHFQFDQQHPLCKICQTFRLKVIWFNEKEGIHLAKLAKPSKKKYPRKLLDKIPHLRITGLPYKSDSTIKGSCIFKEKQNKMYVLLPPAPKGQRRVKGCDGQVMSLPDKNIFSARQVEHQKNLMHIAEKARRNKKASETVKDKVTKKSKKKKKKLALEKRKNKPTKMESKIFENTNSKVKTEALKKEVTETKITIKKRVSSEDSNEKLHKKKKKEDPENKTEYVAGKAKKKKKSTSEEGNKVEFTAKSEKESSNDVLKIKKKKKAEVISDEDNCKENLKEIPKTENTKKKNVSINENSHINVNQEGKKKKKRKILNEEQTMKDEEPISKKKKKVRKENSCEKNEKEEKNEKKEKKKKK